MQKGFAGIIILVIVLILVGLAGAYYFGKLPIKHSDNNPKACTQEAKICPDGSSVGRSGPNCEFTPCPSVVSKTSDETTNWKTYINTKNSFSIKYPQDFSIIKGPGEDAKTDQDYQNVDNISFINNSKLTTFGITIGPKTPNLTPIHCISNDDCLQKLQIDSQTVVSSTGTITRNIFGKPVKGLEEKHSFQDFTSKKAYDQISQYFIFPQNEKVLLINLNTQTYSAEEVVVLNSLFDQILSTFKFIP